MLPISLPDSQHNLQLMALSSGTEKNTEDKKYATDPAHYLIPNFN